MRGSTYTLIVYELAQVAVYVVAQLPSIFNMYVL